ncbi:MAG TPA: GntR family transcriptional regulator [Clostridia bacterium]|nr:GntR family transcriptional regulator [Clostridia bacterium]
MVYEGRLLPGNRLPSEESLCEELGVSRVTVREALLYLEQEGFITRRQGLGTFVHPSAFRSKGRIETETCFNQLLRRIGYSRISVEGDIWEDKAVEPWAELLQVPVGEPVLMFTRLFLADGRPVIYCKNHIPMSFLKLPISDLDANYQGNLFRLLWIWCGQEITHRTAWFKARAVTEEISEKMGMPIGTPIFSWDEVQCNIEDKVVCLSENYFDTVAVPLCSMRRTWRWGDAEDQDAEENGR